MDAAAALHTGKVGLENPTDQGGPSSSKGFSVDVVRIFYCSRLSQPANRETRRICGDTSGFIATHSS